ncbi:CAP domain-containing protein [Agathobaculum butyriciproducens]|uniref:CAP domain-containing protein n=1 Tax=Agathobaculum butyriciproducens TaxID=1628085 RepID=UPI002096A37C|nr:CAP domain-containing protein [Agathobaculum butyriciproducens]
MSRIKKIVFAALAAAALTGAAGAVHLDRPVQGSSSVSAGIQSSSAASEVVRLTNSARSQNGYAALVKDGALSDAAAVRAREIAHSFSHTRPSGASFSSALSESGVSYLRAGENIASGQKSASEVVNAWMNSPGHRANILNSSYSRIGSASVNIDGTHYWVQLFAD